MNNISFTKFETRFPTVDYFNITNITTNGTTFHLTKPSWWIALNMAYKILIVVILATIMFAMGCNITLSQLWQVLRRPMPVFVGAGCQFLLLPLVTYGVAHAFQIPSLQAIGMIVWASSPGGTISNMFSYWVQADLPLSITMTTCSTVLALGFMPLNLFIYTRNWTSEQAVIPFRNIIISLISVLVPVAAGILLKRKKPVWAKRMVTLGSIAGLLCIAVFIVMMSILYPYIYTSGWKVFFACFLMPFIGYFSGFGVSRLLCQSYKVARTVAFETGSQNIGIAITVVVLSYSGNTAAEILIFPLTGGLSTSLDGTLVCLLYRLYNKIMVARPQKLKKENETTCEPSH